jgi:hypothetical protein
MNRIEDYYTESPDINAGLSADLIECCTTSVHASVSACGTPPFTYHWYRSIDGINYSSVPGTSNSVNITINPGCNQSSIFIKVIVTDALGHTITRVQHRSVPVCTQNGNCNCHPCPVCAVRLDPHQQNDNVNQFSISPNPVSAQLTLNAKINEDSKFNYEIINLLGEKVMIENNLFLKSGINNFLIDVRILPNEFYCIKITSDGNEIVLPFVVNR